MSDYIKSKLKRKLIKLILPLVPILVIVVIVASGLIAVKSFFSSLFDWNKEQLVQIDLENCTIEELINAINKGALDEESLKQMMITKDNLIYLLSEVLAFNNKNETKTAEVEFDDTYTLTTKKWNEERRVYEYIEETITESIYISTTITNNHFISPYKMDWQLVYVMCIYNKVNANPALQIPNEIESEYESNKKQLQITKSEIDYILALMKPSFTYFYDAVNDGKTVYNKSDIVPPVCASYVTYTSGKHTYTGYVPRSMLKEIRTIYQIIPHASGNPIVDMSYFFNIADSMFKKFDTKLFISLLQSTPGGINVANDFKFYSDSWKTIQEGK